MADSAVFKPAPRRRDQTAESGHLIQRREGPVASRSPAQRVEQVLSSPGRPLRPDLASSMGQAFNADFSAVRIHDGPDAAASARAVGACMYVSGTHVVVGSPQASFDSLSGRQDLAHELYHVKQQSEGPVAGTPTRDGLLISDPSDPYEQAARRAAEYIGSSPGSSVPRGNPLPETPPGPAGAARDFSAIPAQRRASLIGANVPQNVGRLLQRGTSPSKMAAAHQVRNLGGAYVFRWDDLTLQVFDPDVPEEPLGRATFKIMESEQQAPGEDEPYLHEHVVGAREGQVAELTGIYNHTLMSDGPADIYRGFGRELLRQVEQRAKARGAWMIYLLPSPNNVRVDPNTNDKRMEDPTSFYLKEGYRSDPGQKAHNVGFLRRQVADLTEDEIGNQAHKLGGGMLYKHLQ